MARNQTVTFVLNAQEETYYINTIYDSGNRCDYYFSVVLVIQKLPG